MSTRTFILTAAALLLCGISQAQTKPLEGGIVERPGLCGIFHTWGFVGDSLCSGELESIGADGKKSYHDIYEYSWGQRMCAYMGATGDCYSQGGETAKGWISHFWDNPKNRNGNIDAKADPKQAYIVALMANDAKRFPVGDVTTDINIDDYTKNNPETFAGNYAGVIQRLKSIQPDAKFFVVTAPADRKAAAPFNEVVRQIAGMFQNLYVIDLEKYAPDYSDPAFRSMYFTGGHMNAMGYEFTAWMFLNYIDWIIRQNPAEFKETGFIGRELSYQGTYMLYKGLPASASKETNVSTFIQQYKKNRSEWDAAFEFLKRDDLMTIPTGKYPLTARGTFANVQEVTTANEKKKEEKYENHHKYVDIQYVLSGQELIYMSDMESASATGFKKEFNEAKDVEFFNSSKAPRAVVMDPKTFVVAFPGEPHRPGLAPDGKPAKVRKVVVKVPYVY